MCELQHREREMHNQCDAACIGDNYKSALLYGTTWVCMCIGVVVVEPSEGRISLVSEIK